MPETLAPQTLLAFDFGSRNIGVAVGQALITSSNPAGVVRAHNGTPDWSRIDALIREWQPNVLLVGLPLNMDGTDSPMSERARAFAKQLQARSKLTVEMIDERLTSFAAKQARKDTERSTDYNRDPVDAEAACILLHDYYNQK